MFIRISAVLAGRAVAKTDIVGCVSSQTVAYGGASLIWYVPDTGEICEFLDCGGGRAPPKTTVPGCPAYDGTATYSPSYLPGFGATAISASPAMAPATDSSTPEDSSKSGDPTSSETAASETAPITSPPVTTIKGTFTSRGSVEMQTGSDSNIIPSSSAASSASARSSASSVSTGGATFPTGPIKGAFGAMAGMAADIALL